MDLNLTLFTLMTLVILTLFLRKSAKRAEKAILEASEKVIDEVNAYKAIKGFEPTNLLELQRRLKNLSRIRIGAKTILIVASLASLIILMYWLLVSRNDYVLMASLTPLCIVTLALMFRDISFIIASFRGLRSLYDQINRVKEEVRKRIDEEVKAKVSAIIICGGDFVKAITKTLVKLRNTLLILLPSDNIVYPLEEPSAKLPPILAAIKDAPRIHAKVIECIREGREGEFVASLRDKNIAVVIRKLDVPRTIFVAIFCDGQVYMKMVIRRVVRGKELAENIFRDRLEEVREIMSWVKRSYEGAMFIVFLPLKGTTGWSIGLRSLEFLRDRIVMVVLVHEPPLSIEEALTRDVKDGDFKIDKTKKGLIEVLCRSPIFILKNQPTDDFDRGIIANLLMILDACFEKSSGTTDMAKLLMRSEIAAVQYIVYHEQYEEEMSELDVKEVTGYELANLALPEALLVASTSDYPAWIERKVISLNASDYPGFIVSYGLYEINDPVLRGALNLALDVMLARVGRKIGAIAEKERLETILERGLKEDQDVKRAAIILATMNGKPLKELTRLPQSESQSLQGAENSTLEMIKEALNSVLSKN